MKMKKLVLWAICAVAVMIGCKNPGQTKSAAGNDSTTVDSTVVAEVIEDVRVDTLVTDTVSFEKEEGKIKFSLYVEYPVAGCDSVLRCARGYINDFLSGAYDGPMDDARKMIRTNGEKLFDSFTEMCAVTAEEDDVDELFLHKTVTKRCETNTFVTFALWTCEYTGGIHGISYESGWTFSKKSGRCFTYDMMKDLDSPGFLRLMKEGLKKYFTSKDSPQLIDDDELSEELVSFGGSVDELPLPDTEPYMTEEGVTFIYQPYEISYYAAGKPEFTIPFDVAMPYLTTEAKELFIDK